MNDWIHPWRTPIWVIVMGFLLLLFYESAQQYYYVTTFNLSNGQPIVFQEVLISQLTKWIVWIILSIPFILYIRRYAIAESKLHLSDTARYFGAIFIMIFINILLISVMHVLSNDLNFNTSTITELMTFYTFQKGPVYILAYIGIIILIHLFLNSEELKFTVKELSDLKETNHNLYEELRNKSQSEASFTINVKTGNRWKPILLDDIHWIEADDYCVKLHLEDASYTQRSSMKSLEKQLPKNQFIRIHRQSIININSVEEFQFIERPQVKLKNGQSLDIAQSRMKAVREALSLNNVSLVS